MNQYLKKAVPLLCFGLVSCAHFSEMPAQKAIGALKEESFGRPPTEEEARIGLRRLRAVTAVYFWPPARICWGDAWQWKLNGYYSCGWGLKFQVDGSGPFIGMFREMQFLGSTLGTPTLEQPIRWQQGPRNQEKWFALAAQASPSEERSFELVINQVEYEKRTMEKRAAAEREVALAKGAEACKKLGLEPKCFEGMSLDEFTKAFGENLSLEDKVAFHNAHRSAELMRQEREEAARQKKVTFFPNQNNSQQQMTELLLLNQIQRSFQPQNTNCTTMGNNTNCTTTGY